MKKFAVFDIDGTLVRWQLYHAVADALARNGHIKPEAYEAMHAARMKWKQRSGSSFRDYELAVIEVYESTIQNIKRGDLFAAFDAVFDEYKDQVYTYTRDLIKELLAKNYTLLAISGSPSEMVERIADYYGFTDFIGSEYAYEGQRIVGNVSIGAHNKDQSLKKLVARHGLSYGASIAVGDSLTDVAMLELVEKPVAFNPERELFEHAQAQGWKVVVERKNMIYELGKDSGRYQLVKTSVG